ncbi:class I SAM-dependent methyltransferase [Pseudonocardia eucalypti]|uniref:Class I SAM-dependent methyltransferase n=1 Tax=Pseudonocardia eucalypti TaxID=648755 RepID=A0ABP9PGE2_9PSEU|nr:SAM-dependent methyltransferase [Pseudonocardia eucalypti]
MTEHGHGTQSPFSPESAEYWDERYGQREQLWSGEPNGPLVVEVSGLAPGRALDVGCGEGGDAIWLARRGWRVTAMDISQVALDRAAEAAKTPPAVFPPGAELGAPPSAPASPAVFPQGTKLGAPPSAPASPAVFPPGTKLGARPSAPASPAREITWVRASLTDSTPEPGAYDLVTAQYFPIAKGTGEAALRGLLAAVAPGGTLLFVGHDLKEWRNRHDLEFDPARYYEPRDVAELLDDTWTIQVDETRPRSRPAPEGTDHVNDTVLRAVRRSAG